MYRNLAYLPGASTTIAQLTPALVEKHQHGPDMDISRALAEKRKQIDEEIANFKALKEREFQDFENDLLRQRQRQKQKLSTSPTQNIKIRGGRGGALSLLSGVLNQSWPQVNDLPPGEKENIKPGVVPSIRRKLSPVISKPANNITPVTVTATIADESSRSPFPTLPLKRQPVEVLTCFTLPRHQQSRQEREPRAKEELREQALIVSRSHDNHSSNTNLAAILTPTYLPLLGDCRETQIRPLSSISVPVASSVSASIYPLSQHRRIKTEPIIPSNSLPLPSALRTPSGAAIRKHKHVTLQLADSVIVEPSSSYEEGPSPIAERNLDFSGTGGVGFFELDEELASPTRDARFIDDDDDLGDQRVSGRFHKHGQEDDREEHVNGNSAGAGAIALDGQFFEKGTGNDAYQYSASVPIDIVKPSGGLIGSFGH
ncbi:hypothetical protein DV736_g1227, partial [Chaetothyriales sp. CBS 134916]